MLTRLEHPRPLQHLISTLLCEENGVKSSVDVQQQSATSYQIPAELIVVMNHRRPATLDHQVSFNANLQLNIDTNNDHGKGNIKSNSETYYSNSRDPPHCTKSHSHRHPTTPYHTQNSSQARSLPLSHAISPSSPPSAFLTPASMSQIRPGVKPANLVA